MTINQTRRLVYLAMLSAVAIILNIFESVYIGPIVGLLRLGLANIAALLALKLLGVKEMLAVNALRLIVGNLLRGMIFSSTFWISAGGVVLSSIMLIMMDNMDSSTLFSSIMSSIGHSIGQVLVVIVLYTQLGMVYSLIILMVGSVPTGILTGMIATLVLKRIPPLPEY